MHAPRTPAPATHAMSHDTASHVHHHPAAAEDPGGSECRFCEMTRQHHPQCARRLPKRIILVRHGESQGNLDMSAYTTTPDYRIPLTALGVEQARAAGHRIRDVVAAGGGNWKVYFYVSPYARTRATLREVGRAFPRDRVIGAREECRVREQDFGNFQVEERMRAVKETRQRFGRFFFRFPEGESAADVFDRVASTIIRSEPSPIQSIVSLFSSPPPTIIY